MSFANSSTVVLFVAEISLTATERTEEDSYERVSTKCVFLPQALIL